MASAFRGLLKPRRPVVASFLEMAAQSNARPEFLKAPVRFPKLSNSIVAQASRRAFHVSRPARKASMEEKKARYSTGPFSWKAGLLFLLAGGGLITYFRFEKARMERKKVADHTKGVGRPKVGGPFTLMNMEGKEVTEKDYLGKYSLVYFGFTHCPDICPEELDKMAAMINLVYQKHGDVLTPIFVTCDPARDTPPVIKEYLKEFHPKMIGLTGTYDQIKKMCKEYRVYFSTPPELKPGQDYLVDHSIYFYLMDPEGDFVEALGRQHTPEAAAKVINDHISDWRGPLRKS